jgi:DNA-binding transcriptional regulator YhcF (GntR family)
MDTDRQPLGAEFPPRTRRKVDGLSYKFQRLRERLRTAVASGELQGKLPGERTLARRFHVNAKTLSKALTDLAAEGLLDRSIGRGTYVKGQAPSAQVRRGRWMIIADTDRTDSQLVQLFGEASPEGEIVTDVTALRPSFLKQFDAVIDLGTHTPASFIRDLVVRNVPVVAVNCEPETYSVNTVSTDRVTGANLLARDLIIGGHNRIAVVRSLPRGGVPHAVELAAQRYGTNTVIQVCEKDEVVAVVKAGATAILCDSVEVARQIKPILAAANLRIPEDVSLVAVGCCAEDAPCSGHFADTRVVAKSVTDLLRDGAVGHRPTLLWMATRWVDHGTSRSLVRTFGGEAAA